MEYWAGIAGWAEFPAGSCSVPARFFTLAQWELSLSMGWDKPNSLQPKAFEDSMTRRKTPREKSSRRLWNSAVTLNESSTKRRIRHRKCPETGKKKWEMSKWPLQAGNQPQDGETQDEELRIPIFKLPFIPNSLGNPLSSSPASSTHWAPKKITPPNKNNNNNNKISTIKSENITISSIPRNKHPAAFWAFHPQGQPEFFSQTPSLANSANSFPSNFLLAANQKLN